MPVSKYWKISPEKRRKIEAIKKGKKVRPPKKWFYQKVKQVKKYEDTIYDPHGVVGHIWHRLPRKKQIEIVKRK